MPDLLFELFSEEIPARMQKQAAEDLRRLVTNALVEAGVTYEGAQAFATPRRLALHIAGLPARQPDTREERKGPRVGSPEAALAGFLKAAGLSDISQAKIESDPKKGEFYVALIEKPGRPVLDLLADILPATIRAFPWPKSMRWGAASATPGSLRWVRPLRSILATFGAETEEPDVVPFEVDGLAAGNVTFGHRFMAPEAITVRRFEDYVAKLHAASVVLDPERRKAIIRHDARNLAFAQGLELVEDEALLDEVAGLVEWPVVLMGAFDEAFLDVPAEVIRATIRANQKCFVLRQSASPHGGEVAGRASDQPVRGQNPSPAPAGHPLPAGGERPTLANRFLLTANIVPADDGATIIAGNERVIRARLSDAKFFWEQDKKVWQGDRELKRLERFKSVTFHEKLGSQWERIERIRALAKELCAVTGADPEKVDRAALLCKADLLTEVVGEFPELQGLMGRKYALLTGEDASVAAACEEHYKPVGPGDTVPKDPVSVTLALADKLDTLVGFWAIDEKPTGSKDPYALRRAALGVIRLLVENGVRVRLQDAFLSTFDQYRPQFAARGNLYAFCKLRVEGDRRMFALDSVLTTWSTSTESANDMAIVGIVDEHRALEFAKHEKFEFKPEEYKLNVLLPRLIIPDLLSFFHDRLKVMLRDSGARHDLVDAVLAPVPPPRGESRREAAGRGAEAIPPLPAAPPPTSPSRGEEGVAQNDDLLLVVRRVEALGKFLDTEDGKSLLAGFRRAANILRAEEKKDGEGAFEFAADPALLREPVEKSLARALSLAGEAAAIALEKQDYAAAMRAMAALRAPVDAFFDAVLVNAEDAALRRNRLALLAGLRRVTRQVADFSKVAG